MKVVKSLIKISSVVTFSLLIQNCGFILKPENKYADLEGKVMKITKASSLYKSDSTITHAKEPYVIKALNQSGRFKSIYLPVGTKMYVDDMKHYRAWNFDGWNATGRVYINGKKYDCAFGRHMGYLEPLEEDWKNEITQEN